MILVDSSALIGYYRPAGLPGVRPAVAEVLEADLLAFTGPFPQASFSNLFSP